jgi:hypothetical protein
MCTSINKQLEGQMLEVVDVFLKDEELRAKTFR